VPPVNTSGTQGEQSTTQPTGPQPGGIVNMATGEVKHSTTGKSRGNKKTGRGAQAVAINLDQLNAEIGKQFANFTEMVNNLTKANEAFTVQVVKTSSEFAERVSKAAEESGNKAFADALRGVKPTTKWGKVKLHTRRTISFGDVYWIIAGGVVLAVVYNGLAYLFRNKVAFPFSKEFKTGIAADRRMAGVNGAGRPRIQMPRASA
jgi:uncharacterized membrane-anchored protein YhcB (DUF1043 family)